MRYFEMFAGVGGFSLGIEIAYGFRDPSNAPRIAGGKDFILDTTVRDLLSRFEGINGKQLPVCVGLSEVDKHASAVLRYRFPNVKNYGDCTKIDWAEVPDFDLLVGGSPCQDFSIAGKRAGIGGKRSGLFSEYVKALDEKKPAHFIWENVKGVMSSGGGRDFGRILSAFSEAGYSLWWQVLNAKDFGVPQNRERVFVVGTRIGSPREVFFESGDAGKAADDDQGQPDQPLSPSLTSSTGGRHQPMISVREATKSGFAQAAVGDSINLTAPDSATPRGRVGRGIANTLDTGMQQHTLMPDARIRRLTPRECERLMSWPDDWTLWGADDAFNFTMSDTQRYKMCGNGVVSRVVAEVVKAHFL